MTQGGESLPVFFYSVDEKLGWTGFISADYGGKVGSGRLVGAQLTP